MGTCPASEQLRRVERGVGAGESPAEAQLSERRDWGWQPRAEVMG